jgi:hypothetical protein
MAHELGRTVDMAEIKAHLAEELGVALGRSFMPTARQPGARQPGAGEPSA